MDYYTKKREIKRYENEDESVIKEYKELLNRTYKVEIGDYKFNSGRVLEELDPLAFRQGLRYYIASKLKKLKGSGK